MSTAATTVVAAMQSARQNTAVYIADRIAPRVRPSGISALPGDSAWNFTFYTHSPRNYRGARDLDLRRAEGAAAVRLTAGFDEQAGVAREFAIEHALDMTKAQTLAGKGIRNYEAEVAGPALESALMIDREVRVLGLLPTFTASINGAVAGAWSDPSVNPLEDFATAFTSIVHGSGKVPNRAVFSYADFTSLRNNPFIRSLNGDNPGTITAGRLTTILREELGGVGVVTPDDFQVFISIADRDTANLGQAANVDYIYTESAILFVEPQPDLNRLSALYQFEAIQTTVKRYEDDTKHQQVWRASEVMGEQVVLNAAGFRFFNMT